MRIARPVLWNQIGSVIRTRGKEVDGAEERDLRLIE